MGVRLFDREPDQIRATLVRRDVVSDFDYFIVSIDSRHDHNTSYAFTLTPSGAYQDAALGTDGQYDFSWDPVWEGAASIDSQGWSGEWRIPFSQLRFQSSEDATWGLQLMRVIARKQETALSAFVPRTERAGPHRCGHLTGLGAVQEGSRIELLPYVTSRSEDLHVAAGNPFRDQADQFHGMGLDVKYGMTGSLTLDATINPDFGQVEVDPAVVNLTQYETFYEERRPFFVEGAEIFRHGFPGFGLNQPDIGSLFYSRRIGRAPQRSLGGPAIQHADVPPQTTIAGAAKVSGRVGENWSLGLMEAATMEETGRYVGPDGYRETAVVEPYSNYLVGRIRRDFRDGGSTLALQYRETVPNRITRYYQIDFMPSFERNLDGDLVGASVFLGGVQQWSNFWVSSTVLSFSPETDDDRLTRGGPVARSPGHWSMSQYLRSDERKPYQVELNASYARNLRGGWGIFPSLGVVVRPVSNLELRLDPTYRRSHAVAQYLAAVPDPTADGTFGTRYVFSDLDQTTLSLDTRVSWTFTPRLSLQLFLQPFLSAGDYARFKELRKPRAWGWNVYGEGESTLTEGEGHYEIDPDGNSPAEAFLLSNPDFNVRSLRGNAVLRWEYRPGSIAPPLPPAYITQEG